MIDFYFWPTPNGQKVAIMLEEVGLEYTTIPVNILKGEQFAKDFLTISPNNKIPAIVDHADRTGGRHFSLFRIRGDTDLPCRQDRAALAGIPRLRVEVLQWLMFQMASVGPMFGQCGHFLGYAPEKIPYAIERYQNETLRLYKVMDKRLADVPYIAGDYSIADVAIYPWVHVRWLHEIDITQFPNVERWYNTLSDRPAVQRGCALLKEHEVIGDPSDETRRSVLR